MIALRLSWNVSGCSDIGFALGMISHQRKIVIDRRDQYGRLAGPVSPLRTPPVWCTQHPAKIVRKMSGFLRLLWRNWNSAR
jgi:hypothetical protein